MRRLIALIALSYAVVACSGDSAASSVSSSSTTVATSDGQEPSVTEPVDPQFVLFLDGFSEFGLLGDSADAVVGGFDDTFGEPTTDSGWIEDHGCAFVGPMRTVTWIEPGVRLVFVDGETDHGTGPHLAGYSTVLPVDPPWELAGGIRRGMTWDTVVAVYPTAQLIIGGTLDLIRFEPEMESYASIDAAGEIREFFAGGDYC